MLGENDNTNSSIILFGANGRPQRVSTTEQIEKSDGTFDSSVYYPMCYLGEIVERFLPVSPTLKNTVGTNYEIPADQVNRCVTYGEIKDSAESLQVVLATGTKEVIKSNFNIYDYYESDEYDKNAYVMVDTYYKGEVDRDGNVVTEEVRTDGTIYHNAKAYKFNGKKGQLMSLKVRTPEKDEDGDVIPEDLWLSEATNNKLTRLWDIEANFQTRNIQIEVHDIAVHREENGFTNQNLFLFSRPYADVDDLRNPYMILYNYTTYAPYIYKYKLKEGVCFNFRMQVQNGSQIFIDSSELDKYDNYTAKVITDTYSYYLGGSAGAFVFNRDYMIDNIESDVKIIISGTKKRRTSIYFSITGMLAAGPVTIKDYINLSNVVTILSNGTTATVYNTSYSNPTRVRLNFTFDESTPRVYKKADIYFSYFKLEDAGNRGVEDVYYITPGSETKRETIYTTVTSATYGYWDINVSPDNVYQIRVVLTEAFKPYPVNLVIYPASKFTINGLLYKYRNPVTGISVQNVIYYQNGQWKYRGAFSTAAPSPGSPSLGNGSVSLGSSGKLSAGTLATNQNDEALAFNHLTPTIDRTGIVYYTGKLQMKEEDEDSLTFFFDGVLENDNDNLPKNKVPVSWYWYMLKNREQTRKDAATYPVNYSAGTIGTNIVRSNRFYNSDGTRYEIQKGATLYVVYELAELPGVTIVVPKENTDIQVYADGDLEISDPKDIDIPETYLVKAYDDEKVNYPVLCRYEKALNPERTEYRMDVQVIVDNKLNATKLSMTLENTTNPDFMNSDPVWTDYNPNEEIGITDLTEPTRFNFFIPKIRLSDQSIERRADEFIMTLRAISEYLTKTLYVRMHVAEGVADRTKQLFESVIGYDAYSTGKYEGVFENYQGTKTSGTDWDMWTFVMQKGYIIPLEIVLSNINLSESLGIDMVTTEYFKSIKFILSQDGDYTGEDTKTWKYDLLKQSTIGNYTFHYDAIDFRDASWANSAGELFLDAILEAMETMTYIVSAMSESDSPFGVIVNDKRNMRSVAVYEEEKEFQTSLTNPDMMYVNVSSRNKYAVPSFIVKIDGGSETSYNFTSSPDPYQYEHKVENDRQKFRFEYKNFINRPLFVRVLGVNKGSFSGTCGGINISSPASETGKNYYIIQAIRGHYAKFDFNLNGTELKRIVLRHYRCKNNYADTVSVAEIEAAEWEGPTGDLVSFADNLQNISYTYNWGYRNNNPDMGLNTNSDGVLVPEYQSALVEIALESDMQEGFSIEFIDCTNPIEIPFLKGRTVTFKMKKTNMDGQPVAIKYEDFTIDKGKICDIRADGIQNPVGVVDNRHVWEDMFSLTSSDVKFDSATGVTEITLTVKDDHYQGDSQMPNIKAGEQIETLFADGDTIVGPMVLKYTDENGDDKELNINFKLYSGNICNIELVFNEPFNVASNNNFGGMLKAEVVGRANNGTSAELHGLWPGFYKDKLDFELEIIDTANDEIYIVDWISFNVPKPATITPVGTGDINRSSHYIATISIPKNPGLKTLEYATFGFSVKGKFSLGSESYMKYNDLIKYIRLYEQRYLNIRIGDLKTGEDTIGKGIGGIYLFLSTSSDIKSLFDRPVAKDFYADYNNGFSSEYLYDYVVDGYGNGKVVSMGLSIQIRAVNISSEYAGTKMDYNNPGDFDWSYSMDYRTDNRGKIFDADNQMNDNNLSDPTVFNIGKLFGYGIFYIHIYYRTPSGGFGPIYEYTTDMYPRNNEGFEYTAYANYMMIHNNITSQTLSWYNPQSYNPGLGGIPALTDELLFIP